MTALSGGGKNVPDEQIQLAGVETGEPSKRRARPRREAPLASKRDPLTGDQARYLVASSSVIRDPLHHDIRVTEFERALIDTPAFQRLRLINQLAMVDTVYPGAVHTRFLHSLGTLHVCSELIRSCNNSVKALRPLAPHGDPVPVRIGPYAELLARLVALLHDLAHVPYGHVFEREAQIISADEWKDPWRVGKTLDPASDFAAAFRLSFAEIMISAPSETAMDRAAAEGAADSVLAEVRDTLLCDGSNALTLRYPFVFDLVGNTICADLIDYVQRDMYFSGLTEGLATRFLTYLAVIPVKFSVVDGKPQHELEPVRDADQPETAQPATLIGDTGTAGRVALLYYRYNKRGAASTKDNVLPEAVDLVRTRKLVAEKLYFHKTKLAATSMLAAAAHASDIKSVERLWDKSDHEVLRMLSEQVDLGDGASPDQLRRRRAAKKIATDLLNRHVFKPIFRLSWHEDSGDPQGNRIWHDQTGVYSRFKDPSRREQLIAKLEEAIEAHAASGALSAAGSVSISCPHRNMQLKAFEMLVLPHPHDSKVRSLQETVRPTVKKEIDIIQRQHEELWKFEVFVDPKLVDLSSEFAKALAGAIQNELGIPNELDDFAGAPQMPLDDLIRRGRVDEALRVHALTERVSHVHYTELVSGAVAARGSADIEDQLRELGYMSSEL